MKAEATYKNGLEFSVQTGKHTFTMDAKSPLGKDHGPTPKEYLLGAVICCSGMDVVALCKKFHIAPSHFSISAQAESRPEHPRILPRIDVVFTFEGKDIDPAKIIEAVDLSMTKYCGVSAMVVQSSPIYYEINLEGKKIHSGQAKF